MAHFSCKFRAQKSCTFPSKEMENFMSEKRTKILFKKLFGNLAIRFNIIIMNREKRIKKALG